MDDERVVDIEVYTKLGNALLREESISESDVAATDEPEFLKEIISITVSALVGKIPEIDGILIIMSPHILGGLRISYTILKT